MNKLMKTAAWVTAPKMMFAAKNPKKAALMKAAGWAVERVRPNRRRSHLGRNTALGLGAAALAVPLGLWVGRRLRGNNVNELAEDLSR